MNQIKPALSNISPPAVIAVSNCCAHNQIKGFKIMGQLQIGKHLFRNPCANTSPRLFSSVAKQSLLPT